LDACRRVRLAWLSLLLSFPAFYDASMSLTPAGSDQSIYPRVLVVFLAGCALLVALIIVVFVWMGRGYRWARIVYSAAILISLVGMFRSVPVEFERGWYFGVLDIVVNALGAATVWLLFTQDANAWFRTRGGRIAPP
jgi:hypothetical protein